MLTANMNHRKGAQLRANFPPIQQYGREVPGPLIVSQVALEQGDSGIAIERAEGVKYEGCWKYTTNIGSNPL